MEKCSGLEGCSEVKGAEAFQTLGQKLVYLGENFLFVKDAEELIHSLGRSGNRTGIAGMAMADETTKL